MKHIITPLLIVLWMAQTQVDAVPKSRPNVLFIAIDDLNDYISPLDNHPGVLTPNFNRLAKRSVNFANAHCAAPACNPSRSAIFTGISPHRSGLYRNGQLSLIHI